MRLNCVYRPKMMCLQYREKRYFDLFSITGIFGNFVASGGGNFPLLKREFPVALINGIADTSEISNVR